MTTLTKYSGIPPLIRTPLGQLKVSLLLMYINCIIYMFEVMVSYCKYKHIYNVIQCTYKKGNTKA